MQSINGNDGTMSLQVSFDVSTNVDLDQVQVQNRLSQATPSLPAAVNNYGLTTQQTVGIPLLVFAITSPHGTWNQNFLANYATINIEDELARIPAQATPADWFIRDNCLSTPCASVFGPDLRCNPVDTTVAPPPHLGHRFRAFSPPPLTIFAVPARMPRLLEDGGDA